MGSEYDVFLSYTWTDAHPVGRLVDALKRAGRECGLTGTA